jgi:predicted nucleic acid-binding Zn ribbon protein
MFKDGVIYIECDDQLFVTELNFFREKIREKLNDRLGIYAIKKVVIRKKRRAINGL